MLKGPPASFVPPEMAAEYRRLTIEYMGRQNINYPQLSRLLKREVRKFVKGDNGCTYDTCHRLDLLFEGSAQAPGNEALARVGRASDALSVAVLFAGELNINVLADYTAAAADL